MDLGRQEWELVTSAVARFPKFFLSEIVSQMGDTPKNDWRTDHST